MTPQGELITRIDLDFVANNGLIGSHVCQDFIPDEPLSIKIDLDNLFEVNNDVAIYPIKLKTILFSLYNKAEKIEYNIPFEGIYLHYADKVDTGLESLPTPSQQGDSAYKMLHNGQLIIIKNNKIYNILGHEITEKY
jgi:hypothetical protein